DVLDGTAQLAIQGLTVPGKKLLLGYDTNGNGFGFIKAGNQGVTWTPLALQPNGGNVGIGTTTPESNLTVSVPFSSNPINVMSLDVSTFGTGPNSVASYYLRARDLGANSTVFLIRGDGNVGIGTTIPAGPLNISEATGTVNNPNSGTL